MNKNEKITLLFRLDEIWFHSINKQKFIALNYVYSACAKRHSKVSQGQNVNKLNKTTAGATVRRIIEYMQNFDAFSS